MREVLIPNPGPLAAEFKTLHTFKIPGFLAGAVLQDLVTGIEQATFSTRDDEGVARELCMEENVTVHTLRLLMNDGKLTRFVEEVTGCKPVKCFIGRLYRMDPGGQHYDSWHEDVDGRRMIGISINLSPKPYEGGVFHIKDVASDQVIRSLPNTGLGDAIFFRIDQSLKHKVTPVEGSFPKVAFAGWFQNAPTFAEVMRESFAI